MLFIALYIICTISCFNLQILKFMYTIFKKIRTTHKLKWNFECYIWSLTYTHARHFLHCNSTNMQLFSFIIILTYSYLNFKCFHCSNHHTRIYKLGLPLHILIGILSSVATPLVAAICFYTWCWFEIFQIVLDCSIDVNWKLNGIFTLTWIAPNTHDSFWSFNIVQSSVPWKLFKLH